MTTIKKKVNKDRFLTGLFEDFGDKFEYAWMLMFVGFVLLGILAFIVNLIPLKFLIPTFVLYCICYLFAHSQYRK